MNEFNDIFTGNPTLHSDEFSEEDFSLYALKKGDVLICRTNGNPRLVGKSALAAKDYHHVYESHLFKIRPKSEFISSEILIVYLNTIHGKKEIEKFSMQGNQANFSLAKFKEMRIPKFNKKFNAIITDIVSSSFLHLMDSEEKYTKAKKLLLSELGLTNWKPKHQLSFVRNLSEVEDAERLDAEYLQPKYDEVIELFLQKNGTPLQKIASLTKGNQARCETGTIPYASIKDIHDNVIESEEFAEGSNQLVLVSKDDLALAITGATTGKIGINIKNEKIAICGDLLRIHAKDISPYYLLAFLALPLVTDLFKRSITGMTNGHLSPEIVKDIPVPILEENVIEQIDNGIKKAFSLREQSKHLLECAKRAVEIAIEQDEQAAIEWLEKEIA